MSGVKTCNPSKPITPDSPVDSQNAEEMLPLTGDQLRERRERLGERVTAYNKKLRKFESQFGVVHGIAEVLMRALTTMNEDMGELRDERKLIVEEIEWLRANPFHEIEMQNAVTQAVGSPTKKDSLFKPITSNTVEKSDEVDETIDDSLTEEVATMNPHNSKSAGSSMFDGFEGKADDSSIIDERNSVPDISKTAKDGVIGTFVDSSNKENSLPDPDASVASKTKADEKIDQNVGESLITEDETTMSDCTKATEIKKTNDTDSIKDLKTEQYTSKSAEDAVGRKVDAFAIAEEVVAKSDSAEVVYGFAVDEVPRVNVRLPINYAACLRRNIQKEIPISRNHEFPHMAMSSKSNQSDGFTEITKKDFRPVNSNKVLEAKNQQPVTPRTVPSRPVEENINWQSSAIVFNKLKRGSSPGGKLEKPATYGDRNKDVSSKPKDTAKGRDNSTIFPLPSTSKEASSSGLNAPIPSDDMSARQSIPTGTSGAFGPRGFEDTFETTESVGDAAESEVNERGRKKKLKEERKAAANRKRMDDQAKKDQKDRDRRSRRAQELADKNEKSAAETKKRAKIELAVRCFIHRTPPRFIFGISDNGEVGGTRGKPFDEAAAKDFLRSRLHGHTLRKDDDCAMYCSAFIDNMDSAVVLHFKDIHKIRRLQQFDTSLQCEKDLYALVSSNVHLQRAIEWEKDGDDERAMEYVKNVAANYIEVQENYRFRKGELEVGYKGDYLQNQLLKANKYFPRGEVDYERTRKFFHEMLSYFEETRLLVRLYFMIVAEFSRTESRVLAADSRVLMRMYASGDSKESIYGRYLSLVCRKCTL